MNCTCMGSLDENLNWRTGVYDPSCDEHRSKIMGDPNDHMKVMGKSNFTVNRGAEVKLMGYELLMGENISAGQSLYFDPVTGTVKVARYA